ncbi:DoxX family membrane protein [Candidatus Pacearchaeota archaeon]|nr:DoxX family membrane protein [Candidatus Pacearchaeota archaeon]
MSLEEAERYAPAVVRYGVGIVFFLLGVSQITGPEGWIAWFPSWITSFGFSIPTFIFLNGIFDSLVGLLLIIGLLTRIISLLAVLHLVGVISVLGYNDIAIRDFGLLLAALSVFLHDPDKLCLDSKIWKR